MAVCPDCDALVPRRPGTYIGQLVDCPECGIALEVIGLKPYTVDYYQGEERWEEEEEEEEEE
jgi:lysine biosynthesis protein LysW